MSDLFAGKVVTVYNQSLSGKLVEEGQAVLVLRIGNDADIVVPDHEYWYVRFGSDDQLVSRSIRVGDGVFCPLCAQPVAGGDLVKHLASATHDQWMCEVATIALELRVNEWAKLQTAVKRYVLRQLSSVAEVSEW